MDFDTGMEKHTDLRVDDAECAGCSTGPAAVAEFRGAIRAISGKWKLELLLTLMDGPMRFGELRRSLPGITQHMLTAQLRELEHDGLVLRTTFAEVPLRVEYELTDAAWGLLPVFRAFVDWSKRYGPGLRRNAAE
jgi:DNA-binding HxlR family transcriptional regulator